MQLLRETKEAVKVSPSPMRVVLGCVVLFDDWLVTDLLKGGAMNNDVTIPDGVFESAIDDSDASGSFDPHIFAQCIARWMREECVKVTMTDITHHYMAQGTAADIAKRIRLIGTK